MKVIGRKVTEKSVKRRMLLFWMAARRASATEDAENSCWWH